LLAIGHRALGSRHSIRRQREEVWAGAAIRAMLPLARAPWNTDDILPASSAAPRLAGEKGRSVAAHFFRSYKRCLSRR